MTEFGFIENLRKMTATLPDGGFEGIGDDCAIYPLEGGDALVVTVDALNEGVHFLRNSISAAQLAAKSLEVNISDVAAMGATPIATLLSLGLPADLPEGWLEEFSKEYIVASQRTGVALIGGDTTASQSGITISVTAIGRTKQSNIKRRSEAVAGDVIMVGGRLGASAAGLRDTLNGLLNSEVAQIHRAPKAQVAEGIWLGGQAEVHAMMDISDGLASDLCHILKASNVGARLIIEQIPCYEGATIEDAVAGGEDYKLLFTVAADSAERLCEQFRAQFGYAPYPIGTITSSTTHRIEWCENGLVTERSWRGFEHF